MRQPETRPLRQARLALIVGPLEFEETMFEDSMVRRSLIGGHRRSSIAHFPEIIMSNPDPSTMDFVRELRLRQWARQHFVPSESRKSTWHPIVLDEMRRRDHESTDGIAHEMTSPAESSQFAEIV